MLKYLFSFILFSLTLYSFGQNWVQDILDTYSDSIQTYGMVALVDDGNRKYSASIGVSHKSVSIDTKKRFCIGSCTKMFTAVLILHLHEEGVLAIDNPISNYIEPHPFIDSTITVKQLLNHTSGITDFTKNGFVNEPLLNPSFDFTDSYILSKIDTIEFEKGTKYQYSNTNYFLLRKIIESTTDKPYESVLTEYILNPLKLENTFPYYSNQIENLAHPIVEKQDLHEIPKFGSNQISKGIGNIVSDLTDLNVFIRELFINKSLLSQKTLNLMLEFYSYKNNKVGLGIFSESNGNRTFLGHTGRQVSYISYAFVDIKEELSYVILTNNSNDIYIDKIFEKLSEIKP